MFNFTGKVVNQKNIPIKNAKVSFEGIGTLLVNYTDGEGIFRFQVNIISGNIINVNIRVEVEGYEPYNRYTDLSIDNKNLEEIRLIENNIENSSKPPAAINVAKIGAIATVAAALIGGGAMLSNLINGKISTPIPAPSFSKDAGRKVQTELTPTPTLEGTKPQKCIGLRYLYLPNFPVYKDQPPYDVGVVVAIRPGYSANLAGLQKGDVIISVNGQSLKATGDIEKIISTFKVGDLAFVRVFHPASFTMDETKVYVYPPYQDKIFKVPVRDCY